MNLLFFAALLLATLPVVGQADDKVCGVCHRDPRPTETGPECLACHQGQPIEEASMMPIADVATPVTPAMVHVSAGSFVMGHNGRHVAVGPGDPDEQPLHTVWVNAFRIDQYEITNTQYQAFVDAVGHRTPWHWQGGRLPAGKAFHPVVYVNWYDAYAYCRWAGKRLPSEAEWEKAARGPEGRVFPWGSFFDPHKANTPQYWLSLGRKKGHTLPVGNFEGGKSVYGAYDLAGSVYEWTASWYRAYPGNGAFNIHYGTRNKVVRGGSWYDCLSYACGLSSPSYNRTRFTPEIRNSNFGFRCAAPAP